MNMIVPLLVMVVMMIVSLAGTGWKEAEDATNFLSHLGKAMGRGSGSSAVLYAVTSAILVASVMYRIQGIVRTRKLVELSYQLVELSSEEWQTVPSDHQFATALT